MEANRSVVSLAGELDLSTIPRVEKQLSERVRSGAGLVLDLSDLAFIDSSGIALIIRAHRDAEVGAGPNLVIAPGSQVERVFRLAGVDRVLPVFNGRAPALEDLNGAVGS
jgi:anti-anti-sigma factor